MSEKIAEKKDVIIGLNRYLVIIGLNRQIMAETVENTAVQPVFVCKNTNCFTSCNEMPQLFNIIKGDLALHAPIFVR